MEALLNEVTTDALMREVQRRLDCSTKPDKRVILIGAHPATLRRNRGRGCAAAARRGPKKTRTVNPSPARVRNSVARGRRGRNPRRPRV